VIINIQNISRNSQMSPGLLADIAGTGEYTRHFDADRFSACIKQALLVAVVTCDKRHEGVCVCTRSLIPDSCEIDMICVGDGFRSKGLGRKLLSHSLRNMRGMKMQNAFLWVNENNTEALKFFAGFGFKPDGKRRTSKSGMPGEELRMKIDII